MSEKERQSGDIELSARSEIAAEQSEPMLPAPVTEKQDPAKASLHPAFYIGTWISLSGLTILFNVCCCCHRPPRVAKDED